MNGIEDLSCCLKTKKHLKHIYITVDIDVLDTENSSGETVMPDDYNNNDDSFGGGSFDSVSDFGGGSFDAGGSF